VSLVQYFPTVVCAELPEPAVEPPLFDPGPPLDEPPEFDVSPVSDEPAPNPLPDPEPLLLEHAGRATPISAASVTTATDLSCNSRSAFEIIVIAEHPYCQRQCWTRLTVVE
jgi:hypothetical protein